MDVKEMSRLIVQNVGGEDNIGTITHCMTRLRLDLKDNDKIKAKQLERIDGVISVQMKNGQLQIIIGPEVQKVFKEIQENTSFSGAVNQRRRRTFKEIPSSLIEFISSTFIPVTIALGGAGLIKGLLSLFTSLRFLAETSDVYQALNIIADASFYFLPFLLAAAVAKRIKTNEFLALTIAGILMYPTLINGSAEAGATLSLFGLPIPLFSYATSVIPIIMSVILLKYIFEGLKKVLPSNVEMVITSGLALLITGIAALTVLAPAGNYLGVFIADFFVWLYAVAGPVAGIVFGISFPILVMTGMAYTLLTVVFQNIGTLGYDFVMLPIMIISNINQGIANFVVALKHRDSKEKALAWGTGFTAILGITEPAMYSVNLRYKKPFYAAVLGNAAAGLMTRILDVKMFTYAGSGVFAIPAYSSTEYASNFFNALICLAIGIVTTFVTAFLIVKREDLTDEEAGKDPADRVSIGAVGLGEVLHLTAVPDATFSEKLMGEGLAVDIRDGNVYAPADSEVTVVLDSGHAVGLRLSCGVELLIHVGIDTVNLNGLHFETLVQPGDWVQKGQKIIEFDYEAVSSQVAFTPTIVVVTNSNGYQKVEPTERAIKNIDDTLMDIIF